MKKVLLIMAMLVGQIFATDDVPALVEADAPVMAPAPVHVPLTARFITADDLSDESPIHANMMAYVGAVGDAAAATWEARKVTMNGQIATGTFRRVLFFRGDELVTSCASGCMPLHIYPVTPGDAEGTYGFTNGQESIAAVYRELVNDPETVEDLFAKPGFFPGSTWRIREVVADSDHQEILAAALMPNIVSNPALLAEMHKAAHTLFAGVHLLGFPDRLPSLYVSMVMNFAGIADADFGDNLSLKGLHNYYPAEDDGMRYILAGDLNS